MEITWSKVLSGTPVTMVILRERRNTVFLSFPLGTIFRPPISGRSNSTFSRQSLYQNVRLDERNNFSVGLFYDFRHFDDEIPNFRFFSTSNVHHENFSMEYKK